MAKVSSALKELHNASLPYIQFLQTQQRVGLQPLTLCLVILTSLNQRL